MHENGLGPAELVTTRHEQCGFTNLHTEKTRNPGLIFTVPMLKSLSQSTRSSIHDQVIFKHRCSSHVLTRHCALVLVALPLILGSYPAVSLRVDWFQNGETCTHRGITEEIQR